MGRENNKGLEEEEEAAVAAATMTEAHTLCTAFTLQLLVHSV